MGLPQGISTSGMAGMATMGRRETTPLARVGGAGHAVAFPGTWEGQMDFNIIYI